MARSLLTGLALVGVVGEDVLDFENFKANLASFWSAQTTQP